MTPNQVRARINKRNIRACSASDDCPGWRVVDSSSHNTARLIACAECNELAPARLRVTDAQVRTLREACDAQRDRIEVRRREKRARSTTTHLRIDVGSLRVHCGHALGWSENRRRRHWWTHHFAETNCTTCIRLATESPQDRAAREVAKKTKLAELKARKQAEKDTARAARLAIIEDARPEAMTLLDALEEGGGKVRPALRERLSEVLAIAIDVTRLAGRGGSRLWVSRRMDPDKVSPLDVHCRFCDAQLDTKRALGRIYSDEFQDHTVRCALTFLAAEHAPKPCRDLTPVSDDHTSPGLARDNTAEAPVSTTGTGDA